MVAATLLLATLLAAPSARRLDVAVGAAAQVGPAPSGPLDPSATAGGVDLTPVLSGLFAEPGVTIAGSYAPRILLRGGALGPGVRHGGLLSAGIEQTRTLRLVASERFGYGRNDFTWDPGSTRPFNLLEPIPQVISDNLFTDSELGFVWLPARGTAFNLSAGYAAYGGLSAASQRSLPLQHGPQLYAGLDRELTRNDTLSTGLYAAQVFASTGAQSSQVQLSEGWQRQLDAATKAKLSAGGSVYRNAPAQAAASVRVSPVAQLEIGHDLLEARQRIELSAAAAYAPHQNPLTARLLQRAEVSGAARWVRDALSLRARAAAAREADTGGSRFVLGAVDAGWQLAREVTFSLGAEAVWQTVPQQETARRNRWFAFTALEWRARGLL